MRHPCSLQLLIEPILYLFICIWRSNLNNDHGILFHVEPYEWDVCLSCYHDVKHSWNLNCCLHQNWFHGHFAKPLSPFWNYICLHKWVSKGMPLYVVVECNQNDILYLLWSISTEWTGLISIDSFIQIQLNYVQWDLPTLCFGKKFALLMPM